MSNRFVLSLATSLCWLGVTVVAQQPAATADDPLANVRAGREPADLAELRALEAHVQALLERVLPATVSLDGAAGVIVDGGYVMTAGHVTRERGRAMRIRLEDGRTLRGESLGLDMRTDTGLIKIVTEGDFPTCPLGHSSSLTVGQWCLMLGQPGGFKDGRSAPARLGRIVRNPATGYLVSDCTMQAGDSGGPLFDLDGNVIGINSRISGNLAHNMHVPVDTFRAGWDDLVAGKVVEAPSRPARQSLGLRFESGEGVVVREVVAGSTAARADLRAGDVIVAVNGTVVTSLFEYARAFRTRTEETLLLAIRRGTETFDIEIDLDGRGR